ncbi:MAG: hypothetical protein J7641_05335 [Cyanobacteria bacterium SID2]|nr:hypothetical protein [Cyanobacteria bacterium SID2]MBP0004821.1 hypothetical protein [Cyanobacteria bacterium SBC]
MKSNDPNITQLQFSGLSFWLTLLLVVFFLSAVGLGWLVKSIVILFALIPLIGLVALFGVQWWIGRSLVRDRCPVCGFEMAGLQQQELIQCPNCGETLKIEDGRFQRSAPPGTIDVQAIDVSSKALGESQSTANYDDRAN